MTKEPTEIEHSIGVALSGSPDIGQQVTLSDEKVLEMIFGTKHPEIANGLMRHCFKVLKGNEASDDYPGNDERSFMLAVMAEIKPRDTFDALE